MPLPAQVIKIPTGGGLAEKVSANLVDPPNASDATNVQFRKDGAAQRRFGTAELDAAEDFDPRYQVVGSETNLIALDEEGLHYWQPEAVDWAEPFASYNAKATGAEFPHSYRKFTQESNRSTPLGAAAITNDHVFLCTYTELSGNPYYKFTILSRSTFQQVAQFTGYDPTPIVRPSEIHGTSMQRNGVARVAFWFGYDKGTDCEIRYTTLTSASTSATFASAVTSTSNELGMDVCEGNGTQLTCFAITSDTDIKVGTLSNDGATITTATIAIANNSHIATITPYAAESGYVVAYARAANDLGWKELNSSLAVTFTYSGTSPIAGLSDVFDPKIYDCSPAASFGGAYGIIGEYRDGTAPFSYVLDDGGTSFIASSNMTAIWPGSRPFILTDNPRRWAFYGYPGGTDANMDGIYDQGMDLMVSVLPDDNDIAAGSWTSIGKVGLYNTHEISQQVMSVSQSSNTASSAAWITSTPVESAMEFHFCEAFPSYGKSGFSWKSQPVFNCGRLHTFDGSIPRPVDVGGVPEITNVAQTGGSAGSYTWRAVLVYTDDNGNVCRSAPSNAITEPIGVTSTTVTVQAPEWALIPRASCELYRTEDAGSILYWLGSGAAGLDTASASGGIFSFTETGSSTPAANKTLYTEGGELEAGILPQPYLSTATSDRVWIVAAEKRDEIWFSKTTADGIFLEFNSAFRLSLPQGGEITGIAALVEKLIVFKEDCSYIVYGDGPNNAGFGSAHTVEALPYGIGCTNPNSVAAYPGGVIFLAKQGLYKIDASLQPNYIGAAVEDKVTDNEITSATCFPARSEVRLTTDANIVLVYNYLFDRWSTFTGIEANSSTLYDGDWVYLNRDSGGTNVAYESALSPITAVTGSYTAAEMTWSTPWVKLTSVQDYKRIMRASLLFSQPSWPTATHTSDIQVVVSYNYDSAGSTYAKDTHTFAWSSISAIKPIQAQLHIEKQKVQAIKFEVSCTNPVGLGLALDGIDLQIGTKAGVFKVPAAQKG